MYNLILLKHSGSFVLELYNFTRVNFSKQILTLPEKSFKDLTYEHEVNEHERLSFPIDNLAICLLTRACKNFIIHVKYRLVKVKVKKYLETFEQCLCSSSYRLLTVGVHPVLRVTYC